MHRDTYITGLNPSLSRALTIEAHMTERGGLQAHVVRKTAAPGKDWEFNLADWWARPGRNVNVGVRITCDGPCPGTVALWHSPIRMGASMTVYQIPFTCEDP